MGRTGQFLNSPHSPDVRSYGTIAYDQERQEAVLFGGYQFQNMTYLNDTWTFDGSDWIEQYPQIAPSPRGNSKMAYDPVHQQSYLFGGVFNIDNDYEVLGDMWSWDGSSWQRILTDLQPSRRWNAQMVFDAHNQNMLLYGGNSVAAPLNDTWIWDGQTWTEMNPAHHPSDDFDVTSMAFDESKGQVFLVGESGNATTQTWTWNGSDWTKLHTLQGLPENVVNHGELAYIPELQTVAFFGFSFYQPSTSEAFVEQSEVWVLDPQYLTFLPQISQ